MLGGSSSVIHRGPYAGGSSSVIQRGPYMFGAAVVSFREGHMLGAAVVSFTEGHMLGAAVVSFRVCARNLWAGQIVKNRQEECKFCIAMASHSVLQILLQCKNG